MQKGIQQKSLCLLVLLLSSCAFVQFDTQLKRQLLDKDAKLATILGIQSDALKNVPIPKRRPIIAVYPDSFTDQTGQRKSNSEFALFSTAITQAPHSLLLRALKYAGNGEFFRVVERVGLDNLTKERQLIRSARKEFNQDDIQPLLFAGLLLEGAVIAYDANIRTGGGGARYLGIGKSVAYREDVVSISLRLVSTATGEVLLEVLSQKTIFSYANSDDAFRFIELGTELVELEFGVTYNESTTIALSKAIEQAVLEIINIGYDRGFGNEEIYIYFSHSSDDCDLGR
jgi:curli production assembly/transport component CsgG